eukprot:661134-Pleurochrysis_carterae.AAC.2
MQRHLPRHHSRLFGLLSTSCASQTLPQLGGRGSHACPSCDRTRQGCDLDSCMSRNTHTHACLSGYRHASRGSACWSA